MHRREYLALISTSGTLGLAGCGSKNPDPDTQTESETRTDSPATPAIVEVQREETLTHTFFNRVQLREFGWTDEELDYGTPGAVGVLENVGDTRIGQVDVEVQFYDGDTQIGSNISWHDFLDAGEYGRIEVPYTDEDPSRVTRLQISATPQERITPVNDGEVTLSDSGVTTDEDGWPTVEGTADNATDGTLNRVLVFANFYNGQELLGQGRDALEELGADEMGEWTVSISPTDVEVTRHYVTATVQE